MYQKPKLLLHLSNEFNSRLPARPVAKEFSGTFLLLEKRKQTRVCREILPWYWIWRIYRLGFYVCFSRVEIHVWSPCCGEYTFTVSLGGTPVGYTLVFRRENLCCHKVQHPVCWLSKFYSRVFPTYHMSLGLISCMKARSFIPNLTWGRKHCTSRGAWH